MKYNSNTIESNKFNTNYNTNGYDRRNLTSTSKNGFISSFIPFMLIFLVVINWKQSYIIIFLILFIFVSSQMINNKKSNKLRVKEIHNNGNYAYRYKENTRNSFVINNNNYCSKCRTKLEFESIFCSNCGISVN